GTASLAAYSAASSTSAPKSLSISSRPDTPPRTAAGTSGTADSAASATAASTDRPPGTVDRPSSTAAAPSRSSTAGRRVPSGQRSPAAMTPIAASAAPYPRDRSQRATAGALRRHPATTGMPVAPAAAQIAEPFGDGSTRS